MVERFVDKEISVLERICANNFKADSVSDYGIKTSEQWFIQIVEQFQTLGWLKISHTSPLDLSGEEPDCDGKTLIYYRLINKKGLSDLLLKLKKEYPKLSEPHIREKSLELIARDIGEFDTGIELVRFLKKSGVEEQLIVYPNTKWRMIYDILVYLSYSARPKDWEILSSIIIESIHPLMHNGDWGKSKQLCEKFNQYLVYDRLEINYLIDERKYKISYEPTKEEEDEFYEEQYEVWRTENEEALKFLKKSENKEKIAIVRKAYQVLINIIETFCQNSSHPTTELNDAYVKIKELVRNNASQLKIIGQTPCSYEYHISNFYIPFSNLFGAEAQFKNNRLGKIDWNEIRPELHKTYGEIDALFREINGSDILSEPNIQKLLNDTSMLVSETKKKNESSRIKTEKQVASKPSNILKVEIAEMPELKIRGISEKPPKNVRKIKLANIKVEFSDNEAKIFAGKSVCPLPPFKNEHFFCRAMFNHIPNEFIDWSIIYKEMEKAEPTDKTKNKRAIQDAMYAVNNRIKEVFPTDDELFTWKEKSIARNY